MAQVKRNCILGTPGKTYRCVEVWDTQGGLPFKHRLMPLGRALLGINFSILRGSYCLTVMNTCSDPALPGRSDCPPWGGGIWGAACLRHINPPWHLRSWPIGLLLLLLYGIYTRLVVLNLGFILESLREFKTNKQKTQNLMLRPYPRPIKSESESQIAVFLPFAGDSSVQAILRCQWNASYKIV